MSDSSRRSYERISCRIPVRVWTPTGWISGTIVDLSRKGIRLQLSMDTLGLARNASMGEVAARLPDLLPRNPAVEFDPDRLGPLLCRRLDIVRIAAQRPGELELGCKPDILITDEEAGILGIMLPWHGDVSKAPRADMPPAESSNGSTPSSARVESLRSLGCD